MALWCVLLKVPGTESLTVSKKLRATTRRQSSHQELGQRKREQTVRGNSGQFLKPGDESGDANRRHSSKKREVKNTPRRWNR